MAPLEKWTLVPRELFARVAFVPIIHSVNNRSIVSFICWPKTHIPSHHSHYLPVARNLSAPIDDDTGRQEGSRMRQLIVSAHPREISALVPPLLTPLLPRAAKEEQ